MPLKNGSWRSMALSWIKDAENEDVMEIGADDKTAV